MKQKKNNKRKDNKIINIITSITSILLIVLSVSLFYSVFRINILNGTLLIVLGVILAIFDFLLIFFLNNKKISKYIRYILSFVSIIFIVIYSVGIIYSLTTAKFISNITKTNDEYQTYYVMVNKNSEVRKIKQLDNTMIGFLSNNTHLDQVKNALNNKANISFDARDYSDKDELDTAVNNKEVTSIVLGKSYLTELEENKITVFSNYRKIYTFKVKIKKTTTKTEVKADDSFILYISGSDSRGSISDTARSDVNILAVVNKTKHKILLVSIPRDYYVQLHGTTGSKDKLTHAGIYGIDMSKDTISDLLGVNIDRYLKVGFNTVIQSVDILGGIDVYSDKTFTAFTNKNCKFEENRAIHVNGECALAFSRERYAYESGDRHRGENQEQVITKMIEKATRLSVLTKYDDILKALDGSFETDMSYSEITSMVKNQISSLSKWTTESISLDGEGSSESTYSMGSQKLYVMIPNETSIQNAKSKIEEYLSK